MTEIDQFLDRWTTGEREGDAATLDTLLTDDFVGVGPLGFTLPKPAWLGRHASGDLTYETFELDELQTRVHGDTAVITARNEAQGAFMGQATPPSLRVTLVVVNGGGGWQLAGLHYAFIAGTPGAPPLPPGARATEDDQ